MGTDPSDNPTWSKLAEKIDSVELRTDVPHSARMYDYYLGGKDNFAADREAAEQALAAFPHARTTARANRAFLRRAVRYLVTEAGIRQFLDIGTGIPTSPNLHEVAQGAAPECRVVYTDNDPIVLAHARALLTSTPEGRTAYLNADLREPAKILESAELRDTLDLTQPVALSLVAILHFFPDETDPFGIVRTLLDALPSGSYLVLSHGTSDFSTPEVARRFLEVYRSRGIPMQARTRDEVARFFDGLDLVEPGIQTTHRWRPDLADEDESSLTDEEVAAYAAIARKP